MAHDGALAGLCMPPRALLTGLLCVALALVAEESSSTGSFSLTALQSTRRATNAETLQRRGFAGGAPEPNVAWLMSGSVRTLPLPFVYKSIKHNAIDAFGGRSYVLGYLKTEESPDLMFIDNWDVHTATASSTRRFGTLDPVLAYLEFNVVEVARILNDTTRINVDCDFMTNKHVVPFRPRAVGQMRSLAKVWALLLEFERKQGIVFDFVIRLRPDTAFLHSLPAWPTWVEAVNENRAAGLGGPGPGLGMHTWVPGLKLWPHVTSFRERGGSVPLFLPPENCFVRWHAHNPRLLLPCGFFQILTCIAHFHNIPLSQLDVPADHFAIHTRAAAETTFSMADLYDRCKGADLLAPDSTHWCCGGGITSLNMWSILQQHPNGALICAQHYILQETHTFSFLTATLTEFPFPVLLVRPRWVTYDSCTARNDPIQRYGGDWLPRCAMSNMPGCGEEDQDELAAAVASAGAWAPARRVRN